MDGLELDHETHCYTFNGEVVGGISEIMSALGLVDRSYFDDYSRGRGTAVHKCLEFWMDNRLDWTTVDPRIKGYVEAGMRFVADAKIQDPIIERSVYHPLRRYAGTPDLICVAFGDPSIPDFKTGAIGLAGLATAGYESAARLAFPVDVPRRRMAVQLFPDGHYKKEDMRDGFDYHYIEAAVSLFNRYHLPRKVAAMKGHSNAAA